MTLSDLTSKTPEELNVMCAELCGTSAFKTECEECYGTGRVGSESDSWPCDDCDSTGIVAPYYYGPNYTDSWDAIMPEVRKLTEDQFIHYLVHLTDVADGEQVGQFRAHYDSRLVTIALILTLTSQH